MCLCVCVCISVIFLNGQPSHLFFRSHGHRHAEGHSEANRHQSPSVALSVVSGQTDASGRLPLRNTP